MHELSVLHDVVRTALDEARRHGASRVTAVHLRVGVLRGLEPENLRFLFPLVAKGSAAEGASLEVEVEPVSWRCRSCGSRGEADRAILICPGCGADPVELSGGEGLRLSAIDVDDP